MSNIKEQIEQLIYAYDLSTLGIESILPDEVKSLALDDTTITDNLPELETRSDLVAYSACYYAYLDQNPKGTRDEFNSLLDPEALEKVSVNIRTKLKDPVDTKDVIEFHSKNNTILTRIDLNRQVKK